MDSKEDSTRAARHNIPSLDGLRALSIGLVILAHARETRGFPAWLRPLTDHGGLGVQVFFVISGFLITTLLTQERARTGRVSLKLFYARRTLRIFPAYYCFLIAIAAGDWLGIFNVPARNLLLAATYTTNYVVSGGEWLTGHTWSLSVEEQFYLVWPLTLQWAGSRRAYWIAGLVAALAPPVSLGLYLTNHRAAINYFPVVAAPIAAGCVLAGVMDWLRNRKRIWGWFGSSVGDIILPVILLLDFGRYNHPRFNLLFIEPLLTLCICCAIVRYTEFPRAFVARVLNIPALAFVGRLSYSLYLWQQVFLNPAGTNVLQTFPLNVAGAIACATLSYYLIERPTGRLRQRLHPAPAGSRLYSVK